MMTSSDENQKASAEVNPDGGGAPTDSGARGSSVTADSNDKAIGDPLTKEESEGKPVASRGDPQQQNDPPKQEPEPESEPEPYPVPKEVPHDKLRDIWKVSVDEALKAIEEREPGWTAEKERADKEEKERAEKEEKERVEKEEKERVEKEEKERVEKEEKNPVHGKEQLDKDLKKVVWTDEGTPPLNREQADDPLKQIDLPPIEPAIDVVETGSEPELVNLEHLFYKWLRAKAPQDDKKSLWKDYDKRRLDYLQTHPGHEAKLDQMEAKVKRPIYTPPPVSETETKNTESEAETQGSEEVRKNLKENGTRKQQQLEQEAGEAGSQIVPPATRKEKENRSPRNEHESDHKTPTADATEPVTEPVKVLPLTLEAAGKSVPIRVKTDVGKRFVTRFGEDADYWSEPQFTLEKTDADWAVTHHARAKHETLLNGKAVIGSQRVTDGDVLAVGREAKGLIKLPLKVRIETL